MAEELILRLKKKRAVNRSYLTKTCNKIESGLDTLMRIELEELLEQLNESFNELKLVDHEIETLLETDDLEKELQGVEEYREKYITWRFRANKKIRQSDFHGENIPNSNSRIDENEMRHYVPSCTTVKLPKLMISKFYGNVSEWLTFWNSFDAAIHQNNSLNPIDKFNYLKSHLGGTALNTVEGFALSADNYEKAIKLLKDRFGREDILISRHMNNLLSMRPLKTSSDVRTFRELFDNLSVHIRSLESLNVSIDVYGQLLCPIIIKLLPADLNLELNKELPTGYVINDLITFLERQLTARERSFINEIGTGNESTSKPNLVTKHPKTRFYNEKPIATASELLNSVHKLNECVFCGKDNHGSPKCDFAANMSLNEKRSLMKKKGVCYKCLRPSHLSKFCRNVVRCSICNMSSHLDVMCTKQILDRGGTSKSPTVQDETLANLSTSPDVLLPTLRVTLKGNRTEKTARAIIDTGSQRSYILHSTAMEMEYEQSRREFFRHSLFGGSSTDVVEHEVYTIPIAVKGSEELDVSDLMRDRIEVLIGADIAGRLLTDDQRRISSGLVAIRTKLGWTVMGKIPATEVRDDTSSLCVTTLLSLDLENLWKLDAIGVSDAEVEKKTQSLQAEMEEHFAHTTTRDIEGRYEVALPWVQDKERIPSNRDLAENQLSSVRRKLEEVGDMKEYGQIFEECINQGIIEYSREDKLDGVHNLPHRPVYKRNSQTSKIRPVFNASARKRGKLSLNDCLDKGPNLIEIIPRLLNKFRKYEVGVSSDIEKAFLQIGIKEEDRDAAVFEIAGVDLTGHLILKNKKKAWIVIFTCAVYRGVHLELVTSLSMETFLQAFLRFIARRGRPLIVYSDNGTNFKGMANALKKIDFSRLKCDPTLKNITWKFIPPDAPWWGGWWERLIGMMKQLLFRILGQTSLGYEELSTVMCDVESLMNTRPLTYLTEESEDLAPLTPSLFLHEVREVGVPDLDLIDNQTLSHKYQYIKRVREDLRERFRIEYFGFLRQETRRLKSDEKHLMLVIDDNKESASNLRAASCRYYRHCHRHRATAAATTLLMAEELILRLKKKRAVNRSYLTKTCNKIESGLDTLMRIELEELLEQLNESFNELKLVDHEIETLLETDDLEKELQGVEEYREKYITWRFRANKKIRQSDFHGENIPNSNSRIDENEMRHYVPSCTTVKLPKLMISKFYGNVSEWLTFWNSFDAAIHQNNSLNPIDKFNYLKSHLGGTALNTVEGFALSADNYEKAIKLLKDRFGREDILISRHMNNLLSMRPLKTSSDVRTFRELFDNLSVHIRSLESLNVSIDVYGQLLCPIIIKLLPADLNLELNKELPTGYVINDLITFLERQLTARERSFINEIGTGNESTSKPNLVTKHPKTRFYNEKPIATASELLNSVHKLNECVFCGKDNHGSPKCDFAANMSLNEKRSLMKKKGVCYKCLRPSHLSKFCRNVVRCSICNMSSHLDVMCTKQILDRGGTSKSPTVQDETLANLSTSPDVLLPTLRVTLKGNRTEKTARAIIDTGSQRSYILHSTAMEMEYEQSRREFFRHSLFGGSSTDVVEHEVYTIPIAVKGSEELDVSDLMRDRIEVLIGADIAGRLLTDDQRRISSGLVAIRTKLGWTVMGKIPATEVRDDTSSLCVTTLLSLDLENLWKLDAIGVSDAEVEKKTQSLQAEMEEHFAHTTTRDIEGRYEVALPWVQDKERIPSNRDLAENQLSSVRRKLEEVGDMKEYGQIFEECINQGIIEYSREDKLDGVHNLPHRPVYKRNSQTSKIRPVFNASARKRGKLSLNDCLDKGPNLIEIIPRLLNKFRKYEVGVSSDIEKAFLQIGIKEEDRDAAVFEIAGVDLTGHLILKNKKKAWIVIFTCAVYRGVHLELVTSLSMETFLQAFLRFIARRGRPLIVYSDNGTNFKGMANALKKIDFSRLKCDPTLKNITWKFIPPDAPWWGGWWERLIGMMKQLLFRILGQTSLGYEELSTVMCDVESLMNTRPLTYLTEESEDLAPLTPSLFLHEVREVGVPDLDLIDNQTLSHKYQYIKRVREDLRERFRIEYFGFLRQETRRLKTTIPFKVGDMVLIGQESLKRLHWPLARIIQLYPGKDGLVRVAKVKTSSGDKIRPIQKLYNLEITPEIRCRDPLTERSPTQEVRLTTEEDPLTSQQEQHHIETPNVVSSYGRPIKRPNRLDLLNFSFPCLSRRDANSK
ncbi:hypothetical protein LAZ67_17002596, partial [Cordylochernes scorpioides]